MPARNNPRNHTNKRLQTGADLHQWRTRMAISARQLGKLIGVTERSIHRAEKDRLEASLSWFVKRPALTVRLGTENCGLALI
jgi:DNA-binding XRE family transcriptional regulator